MVYNHCFQEYICYFCCIDIFYGGMQIYIYFVNLSVDFMSLPYDSGSFAIKSTVTHSHVTCLVANIFLDVAVLHRVYAFYGDHVSQELGFLYMEFAFAEFTLQMCFQLLQYLFDIFNVQLNYVREYQDVVQVGDNILSSDFLQYFVNQYMRMVVVHQKTQPNIWCSYFILNIFHSSAAIQTWLYISLILSL